MRFKVEDLDVVFPYPRIYPEQYQYMLELKRSLDARGHSMLEMPTGTGKTITLLSLITSYQHAHPNMGKLVYCTRTIPEMEKVLEELKVLEAHRDELFGETRPKKLLAIGLSSRRNLCVHETVSMQSEKSQVDQECRQRTAPWLEPREGDEDAPMRDSSIELCSYYEQLESQGTDALLDAGVYTLEELKQKGKAKGWCPYFLARHVIAFADVVVYNYQYLLDPKITQLVSRSIQSESVIVFDEAHNIDNICIEVMSINFRTQTLEACSRNLTRVSSELDRMKQTDAKRLRDEYERLVHGLQSSGTLPAAGEVAGNPVPAFNLPSIGVLPEEILTQAVPGNLRRADSFVKYMHKLVAFLKKWMDEVKNVEEWPPTAFLHRLDNMEDDFSKPMKFVADRLRSLLRTLEVTDVQDFSPLMLIADFATLVSTFQKGFGIIVEPHDERTPALRDPLFQLCCNDASIAIKPVFDRFQSVVITSGTLSPLDMYKKILDVEPVVVRSFQMSFARDVIRPLIVTRGADQSALTAKFDERSKPTTIRNYGKLLLECAQAVPDGVVAFFTSYTYMQEVVGQWHEMGVLKAVLQHKLVFIETTDVVETTLALENFKRACDCGRGAVFLSVARGKVAEGVDFDRHYGRAVLLLGVPFQYTFSRVLKMRLQYLRDTCAIDEADFLTFDAIRQAAQCAGRVIRGKNDYGLVILADARYNKDDKKRKMPQWIQQFMSDATSNLSTDVAMASARAFLREMAQPAPAHRNVSLSELDLAKQAFYVSNQSAAGFVLQNRDVPTGAAPPRGGPSTTAPPHAGGGGELVPMDVG